MPKKPTRVFHQHAGDRRCVWPLTVGVLSEAAVGVGGVVYRDVREGPGEDASAGGVDASAVPGCRGRIQWRNPKEVEGHVLVQFWQRKTNFQWVELTELDGSWVMVGPAYAAGNVYPLRDPRIQFYIVANAEISLTSRSEAKTQFCSHSAMRRAEGSRSWLLREPIQSIAPRWAQRIRR